MTFGLAYHNRENSGVLTSLASAFREKCSEFNAVYVKNSEGKKKIRVGFISQFFSAHTIGKLYFGLIKNLDRERFEVIIIHFLQTKSDAFRNEMDESVDDSIVLPASLQDQQKTIASLGLDILFYPDIGMSPSTWALAFARLAPVQVVSWGHPDTTGIDTIDYFLSADSIESVGAELNYTETLIRINRLPCYYQPVIDKGLVLSRGAYGLPDASRVYGCPQSLFKLHPDFDGVLANISTMDPECIIVFLEGKHPAWQDFLRKRWGVSFPIINDRALFLPRQSQEDFMGLISVCDLLLDPVHFGSGNTLYESMVYGVPTVTYPGRFMRGRIVSGAYRQMNVNNPPVAASLTDYSNIVFNLGVDKEARDNLKVATRDAAQRLLFRDRHALQEIELFFEEAVIAARKGMKLSHGWRPNLRTNEESRI